MQKDVPEAQTSSFLHEVTSTSSYVGGTGRTNLFLKE